VNLFEHAEAFGFELGDGDFFDVAFIPWSMSMVNCGSVSGSTGKGCKGEAG
jgi:hypothetical protein